MHRIGQTMGGFAWFFFFKKKSRPEVTSGQAQRIFFKKKSGLGQTSGQVWVTLTGTQRA